MFLYQIQRTFINFLKTLGMIVFFFIIIDDCGFVNLSACVFVKCLRRERAAWFEEYIKIVQSECKQNRKQIEIGWTHTCTHTCKTACTHRLNEERMIITM